MNQYLVYTHRRKDNDNVFYIGCSKNENRPEDTVRRSDGWKEIHSSFGCNVEVVKRNLSKENALELEKFMIEETENLSNKVYNGWKSWNSGISLTDKHKENLSDNSGKAKQVLNIDSGLVYKNIREAAKLNNINYSTLRGKLNGTRTNNTNLRLC